MNEKKLRTRGECRIRWREADDTWEARFVIGTDPDTGESTRMSVYGKTQKEACEKMLAVLSGEPYAEDTKDNPNRRLSYSVQEAAKMIGVGKNVIYELAKAKKIPGMQIGKRYVINAELFDAWFREQSENRAMIEP